MIQKRRVFTRRIEFGKAFDYIVNGPKEKEQYGRHGVDMWFYLIGPKGAVHLTMMTGWQLPETVEALEKQHYFRTRYSNGPMGVDLGYHSPTPRYEGQGSREDCDVIGGKCHYDGSALAAEPVMHGFFRHGEEWLWKYLAGYYHTVFDTDQLVSVWEGIGAAIAQDKKEEGDQNG